MVTVKSSLLFVFSLFILAACKKSLVPVGNNTEKTITEPTSLIDFGEATYRGFQGGLYPGGSNQRPAVHNAVNTAENEAFYMSGATKGNQYHNSQEGVWNKIYDGVFYIKKMYPYER